jgi:hypothetical protein
VSRSSLTEETPATPGWVDDRIDAMFAPLGAGAVAVREAYAMCLAGVRGAVDTDAGHDLCRRRAIEALRESGADIAALDSAMQALEAEISAGT